MVHARLRRHGRTKLQRARIDGVADQRRAARTRYGAHGRQVLRSQPRLAAVGTNVGQAERSPGQRRQAETGAQDLAATLTQTAVNVEYLVD